MKKLICVLIVLFLTACSSPTFTNKPQNETRNKIRRETQSEIQTEIENAIKGEDFVTVGDTEGGYCVTIVYNKDTDYDMSEFKKCIVEATEATKAIFEERGVKYSFCLVGFTQNDETILTWLTNDFETGMLTNEKTKETLTCTIDKFK